MKIFSTEEKILTAEDSGTEKDPHSQHAAHEAQMHPFTCLPEKANKTLS